MNVARDPRKDLSQFLEHISSDTAKRVLDDLGIKPEDYGLQDPKDLIDHWRKCAGLDQ